MEEVELNQVEMVLISAPTSLLLAAQLRVVCHFTEQKKVFAADCCRLLQDKFSGEQLCMKSISPHADCRQCSELPFNFSEHP